jgi:glycine/D-amino acid oxidase-like deaminating enzyme
MEYGADETYMALMESARERWLEWNAAWRAEGVDPLYHETGVLMICRSAMAPGGFEFESWTHLRNRSHAPERMSADAITRRFPAWNAGAFVDGFYHAQGGFAESGRVVESLARSARRDGTVIHEGRAAHYLDVRGSRVAGVVDSTGALHEADEVIVAAGAWSPKLVPELRGAITPSGHPVVHLRPARPEPFEARVFPTFTADVSRTGYYGFPINRDGIVKIANHGVGRPVDPDTPRDVTPEDVERLRTFLSIALPSLADAEITHSRVCVYDDTENEDFWIDRSPQREGLVVAGGGSGHSFKFAPLLGEWVVDVIENRDRPWRKKFGWRPVRGVREGREAARCHHLTDPLGEA